MDEVHPLTNYKLGWTRCLSGESVQDQCLGLSTGNLNRKVIKLLNHDDGLRIQHALSLSLCKKQQIKWTTCLVRVWLWVQFLSSERDRTLVHFLPFLSLPNWLLFVQEDSISMPKCDLSRHNQQTLAINKITNQSFKSVARFLIVKAEIHSWRLLRINFKH